MRITELFDNGEFVVSAEVGPPKGIHIDGMVEEAKIHCAREHFRAISNGNVVYDVVDSYESLLQLVQA